MSEEYREGDLESFFGCAPGMMTDDEAVAALEPHARCLETINALAAENATLRAELESKSEVEFNALLERRPLLEEIKLLRAFVAAYDADAAQHENDETRQALLLARGAIK